MALELANEYKDMAEKIINKYPENFGNFDINKIMFLRETTKSPKKYAETRKVTSPYNFITSVKFIITVYEARVCQMTEAQLHLLMLHELMHIDEDFEKIVKHDLEDFKVIVSKFGAAWDIDSNLPDILEDEDEAQNTTASIDEDDEIEIL